MNELDQELHRKIHQHMMSASPENIFSERVSLFNQIEIKINFKFSGVGLDIGCGSGYASIWLAKNKPIRKMFAQEASVAAVNELLPRNIQYHKVANIVEPLLGTFDNLNLKEEVDFVISFGAAHHSSCLLSTMKSIQKALKKNGFLIMQEPVMPNTTSNKDYIDKYNIVESMFDMKIRNGDRNDNFFREAEYITAASFAGLDLILYEDFTPSRPKGFVNMLRMVKTKLRKAFMSKESSKAKYPYQEKVMRKVFVFRKGSTEYIPHLWRDLKN